MAQTLKPFISERRLQSRVRALGRAIRADHQDRDLILVGILKGSFIFMADLVRAIHLPLACDFLRVSSYGSGTESSGRIKMEYDLSHPVKGKDVVVVEDIVDTGWTLDYVLRQLRAKKPRSLKLAALLHKPERTRVNVSIDYLGFTIPDRFVVGYGLDFDCRYRNLRHIAVMSA